MPRVTADQYAEACRAAMAQSETIAASLSPESIDPAYWAGADLYLFLGGRAGFAVVDGDLRGVFALDRGKGDALVSVATLLGGAETCDHFDVGPLSDLYERHGFAEVRREANWTPGGPDVIYRKRKGN